MNKKLALVGIVLATALLALAFRDSGWLTAVLRASNPGEAALRLGLYLSGG